MEKNNKAEIYKYIKATGFVFYIPLILPAGPLSGYFLAKFLGEKFGWKGYLPQILITIGLIASLYEAIRIIRKTLRLFQD